ncbi:MAG: ArgR family transcriptional regulator, partial [Spirochaetaceae bacterium]|nr:ArgR family transcriptional regulator [Spirochaetaceae bacterium]
DAGGGYYYVLSETEGESFRGYVEDFKRGYLSLSFSHNLGVIKTLAGHADTVAIAMDRLNFPEILGTIAGDDTILVIIREGETKETLMQRLTDTMGTLENP